MKTIKLILTIMVAAASAFTFTKCTEDETVEAPTKTEILKAKAKELSAKYGIDVTLNEENLESVADTLTVEQMEKDFQIFAALKDATIVGESEPKKKPQRNRLRIKMNKTIEEERDTDNSGSADDVKVEYTAYIKSTDENVNEHKTAVKLRGTANVSWQHALKKAGWVRLSLSLLTYGGSEYNGSAEYNGIVFKGSESSLSFVVLGAITISNGCYSFNLGAQIDHELGVTKVTLSN